MRDHSKHIQVSREEAIAAILDACDFHPAIEAIPLAESFGRVLAHDARARLDMPNCLTCRMDSVAVHWDDFENGMPDTSDWERGVQWEFANTGVGMPEGFDTAIVIEHAQVSDDDRRVSFDALPSARFAGTSNPGSRMHAGDVLVAAGSMITPLLAAHIASGGNTEVDVLAKPTVAFIPTGNELVAAGSSVPRGKNIESNSIMLRGKIEAWGGIPLILGIVPDEPEAIETALREAAREADIVVLNAGSSKGSDDWSLEILERIGRVLYHQTNHGPGHHSSASVLDGTPVIGISGPPGGAAFTTDFYLRPAMRLFSGLSPEPVRVRARLAADFPAGGPGAGKHTAVVRGEDRPSVVEPGETFFGIKQLIIGQGEDGMLEATPTASGRPGPIEAEAADAYYAVGMGPGLSAPKAGDIIEVTLRPCFQIR